jgi:hypothetical protein
MGSPLHGEAATSPAKYPTCLDCASAMAPRLTFVQNLTRPTKPLQSANGGAFRTSRWTRAARLTKGADNLLPEDTNEANPHLNLDGGAAWPLLRWRPTISRIVRQVR